MQKYQSLKMVGETELPHGLLAMRRRAAARPKGLR